MRSVKYYLDAYRKLISKYQKGYNRYRKYILQSKWHNNAKRIMLNKLYISYVNKIYKLRTLFKLKISNSIRYQKTANKSIKSTFPSQFSTKKSLLIGCNYYGSNHQLNGCINDVTNVSRRLSQKGFSNILFTDQGSYKPTYVNILNQLVYFLRSSRPGDLLFFMFSGHGSNVRDRNGDEGDGKDEVIVSSDFKAIKDDLIKKIIHRYLRPDVTLVALFDSCYSGTIMDLKYKYMDSLNYNKDDIDIKQRDTRANVICLSSSLDSQVSIDEYNGHSYGGSMTTSLLQVLKENDQISWRTLIQRIREILIKNNNNKQIPQISSGQLQSIDQKIFI
jgi:hypothetical protein